MKKAFLTLLVALPCILSLAQGQTPQIALIPAPSSMQVNPGHFTLPANITVEAPAQAALTQALEDLKSHLSAPTGYTVNVSKKSNTAATIRLLLNTAPGHPAGRRRIPARRHRAKYRDPGQPARRVILWDPIPSTAAAAGHRKPEPGNANKMGSAMCRDKGLSAVFLERAYVRCIPPFLYQG